MDARIDNERRPADEITLFELWHALARHVWIIVGAVVLAVTAGALYVFLTPTQYQYRSGIDLGFIYRGEEAQGDRYRFVESAEAAEARLTDLIVPAVRRELDAQADAPVPRVSVAIRQINNSVLLTSVAPLESERQVANLHTQVAESLAKYHMPRYQQELELVQQQLRVRLQALEREREAVEKQIALIQEREYQAGAEGGLVALVDAQRLADLRREYVGLEGAIARAAAELDAVPKASRTTQLSFLASRAEQRVGPGAATILALASVFGLMVGVFAALLWEFALRARGHRA